MSRLTRSQPFELDGFWWNPEVASEEDGDGEAEVPEKAGEVLSGSLSGLPGPPFAPAGDGSYGTLTYEPERGFRLVVLDATEPHFPSGRVIPAIHGYLLDGTECTLLDAFVRNTKTFGFSGAGRAEVGAHAFIRGTHVDQEASLTFDRATIKLDGLRAFLHEPMWGLSRSGSPWTDAQEADAEDQEAGEAREQGDEGEQGDETRRAVVQMPGARLTFSIGWSTRTTPTSESRVLDAGVHIELEAPETLEAWERLWVQPLQHLLILATRQRSEVERFTAIQRLEGAAKEVNPAIRVAAPDAFWERREVDVLRQRRWVGTQDDDGSTNQRMLVSALSLGDGFAEMIRQWFPLQSALAGAGRALFGALNAERIHLENRLLTVMSAAEGYHRALHEEKPLEDATHERLVKEMLGLLPDETHRKVYRDPLRYANSQRQRGRLRELMEQAETVVPDLGPLVATTVNQLVNARNYFTHFDEEGQPAVPDFRELFRLTNRLILVLQINLLLDLGLDAERIGQSTRQSYGGEAFP
jgi:hypothetical protein